jgi:hypothetical protein
MSKLTSAFIAVLFLASCSHIVSTNYPGKPLNEFPKSWVGTYDVRFPSFLQFFLAGADSTESTVEIGTSNIVWTAGPTVSRYTTADSLKFTELNGNRYICLHNSHNQYTILKVKETPTGLELFGLTANKEVSTEDLAPFFKKVEDLEAGDLDNETGIKLYQVTMDDKKLDKYYSSKIPAKEPIVLKRKK